MSLLLLALIVLVVVALFGGVWGAPRYGSRIGWSPLVVLVLLVLIVWIVTGGAF